MLPTKWRASWTSQRLLLAALSLSFLVAGGGNGDAAQVLYGFDTDEVHRIGDWLTADGAQDAEVMGNVALDVLGGAAFGAKSADFPGGAFAALEIPNTKNLGSSFTLAAMVSETDDNFSRLFSSYNGGTPATNELVFDMNPSMSGTSFGVRAIVNGATITRSATFADAAYHHLAMTYDDGDVALYLDGSQLGATASVTGVSVVLAENLRFGEDYPPTSLTNELFVGRADDILVYNRALAPLEIASLHQQGAAATLGAVAPPPAQPPPAIDVGGRIQMFTDDHLIGTSRGVQLKLNPPQEREIALQLNQGFEQNSSTYFTATRDEENRVRLYYRGRADGKEVTLMAISDDGIHFTRPSLNVYSHNGSSANPIVWEGALSHNMAPFLDTNPNAAPDAKWKALGGSGSMYAMKSVDGIHWELMQPGPLQISGAFDSQNIASWDPEAQVYRSYSRYWVNGIRAVQMSVSGDFIHWSDPVPLAYDVPLEHFYTNGIVQLENAEPSFVGMPMRFDPTRTNLPSPGQTGVTDAILMTSHDGLNWDRPFTEPWIDEGIDSTRSHMPAWGIIETADDEWSMYSTERYLLPENRLRRLVIRPYGFASASADAEGGSFETPPLTFIGGNLVLNFASGETGSIAVEIRDKYGVPIPGFTLADMTAVSGDELEQHILWNSGRSLGELAGEDIRIFFELHDADLFAMQFAVPELAGDYNGNGIVGNEDYGIWKSQFGLSGIHAADGNRDGLVDTADFTIWRDNLSLESVASKPSLQVPEPRSLVLLVTGLSALALVSYPSRLWRMVPC